jgi:hypothetical protein
VPRVRVLRRDGAVALGRGVVGLVPDDQVGGRVMLPRRDGLDARHLHLEELGGRMPGHHEPARDVRLDQPPVRVEHDLSAVHEEEHAAPLRHRPGDERRGRGRLPEARGGHEEHALDAPERGPHGRDGALLVRSEDDHAALRLSAASSRQPRHHLSPGAGGRSPHRVQNPSRRRASKVRFQAGRPGGSAASTGCSLGHSAALWPVWSHSEQR